MNFIKYHWFNLLIALIIIFVMGFTILIALSPREDLQNRGFIPCTQELADTITSCQGNMWCSTKAIIKNSACDAKVIGDGIKLWIAGKQKTPWSNYIFTPDLTPTDDILQKNTELFYQENPNFLEDFAKVKQEHQKLEESIPDDQKFK